MTPDAEVVHEAVLRMRWSDLDPQRHVNNVRFSGYADEALRRLVASGVLEAGLGLQVRDLEFLRPIALGPDPVVVRTVVTGSRLLHEIVVEGSVRARVADTPGEPRPLEVGPTTAPPCTLAWRSADISPDGSVRPEAWADLVQEARVTQIYEDGHSILGPMVIAGCVIEFGATVVGRQEPLTARSSVTRIGTSSAVITSHLAVGATVAVRARSTLVGFDSDRGGSRPWSEAERAGLTARIS